MNANQNQRLERDRKIKMTRALRQLDNAAANLSAFAEETGHDPSLAAAGLVAHIANALRHGKVYVTVERAQEFDASHR